MVSYVYVLRRDEHNIVNSLTVTVVPTKYGYIVFALVKCSNDGGPGPRHNMKEDPGSSIFSMLVVYGYYLHLLTSFSERKRGWSP